MEGGDPVGPLWLEKGVGSVESGDGSGDWGSGALGMCLEGQ